MTDKTTLKPTTFSTSPNESLAVVDVYNSSALTGINVDVPDIGTGDDLLSVGLPPAALSVTNVGSEFEKKAKSLGKTSADIVKDIIKNVPGKASLTDILKSNKLSDLIQSLPSLNKSAPANLLAGLTGDDIGFILASSSSLTASVMSKNANLTLADLQNADGKDYAILGAVGLLAVRSAMGKRDNGGILGIIKDTKLPAMFRDAGLDVLVDVAASYGLGDVVTSILDIVGDRAKPKRKLFVKKVLIGFKFSDKPVITEVSKNERNLITSVAEYFGANDVQSNVLAELIEVGKYDETFYNKKEQSKRLVDSLYKIDRNWNTSRRNGETIRLLDNYRHASPDAREALLLDDRTMHDMVIQHDLSIVPRNWEPTARIWYPHIYA